MEKEFEINIASYPDFEEVVAEIMVGNEQFAMISQDEGQIRIEFYPKQDGSFWNFKFEEIVEIILQAKKDLIQKS